MKRLLQGISALLVSPLLPPVMAALLAALYIAIAIFSDEALTALMELVRGSVPLLVILCLVPLNTTARLFMETVCYLRRQRIIHGKGEISVNLFDEELYLPCGKGGDPDLFLKNRGYRVFRSGRLLSAWRGFSAFPARFLFLAGVSLLFAGMLTSLTARTVVREGLIEGEPMPQFLGIEGGVDRITLTELAGSAILARDLSVDAATAAGKRRFGLYPPGKLNGFFVYPRYLGVAPLIRFAAPGVPPGFSSYYTLAIYPLGKEDSAEIPNTPYKVLVALLPVISGEDPFITGRFVYSFKVVREGETLLEGRAASGDVISRNGYTIAFPDAKKMVLTDFVRDPGVYMIWLAIFLIAAAFIFYLPIRFLNPRGEILLEFSEESVRALARSEGRTRAHLGVFHELLDLICRTDT